ncbi:MAG TPA: hypothetical protein DEB31_03860 [Clostridiales bacterium]|nr:hypothetical protein [Clostridiales bacterium]
MNATVSQAPSGKYFVSICCTDVDIEPYAPTGQTVGVDMGISNLAALSTGESIPNPKHLRKAEKRLTRALLVIAI